MTSDAGSVSDPDTFFPLQAALRYDTAANLFIGRRNSLVEGISDFIYLTTLSQHVEVNRRRPSPTSSAKPVDARDQRQLGRRLDQALKDLADALETASSMTVTACGSGRLSSVANELADTCELSQRRRNTA